MLSNNCDLPVVKESDYQKLIDLIEANRTEAAEKLEAELSRADVVKDCQYPAEAACMGATVGFIDLTTGMKNEVTLVYPRDANVEDMKISVLTPMGSALIGMRVGGTIEWELPNRRMAKVSVLKVTHG